MPRTALLLPCLFVANLLIAQPTIHYRADLRDLRNDKVRVEMLVPRLAEKEVVITFPRIVPGIYGAMDHGRLASEPHAYDAYGYLLPISREGVNGWRISEAQRLQRLTYTVDDGWEQFNILFEQSIYRSSEGTYSPQVCVIDHNTLFPYIVGHEEFDCSVTLLKPHTQYAATGLTATVTTPDSVVFHTTDYRELVDGPVLLCAPDTAHIRLPDIDVTVACYSTTGTPIAKDVATHIRPLLADQRAYLGGALPVDHYTFLIYHHPSDVTGSSMADGLEHRNSTLILLCMPLDPEAIARHVYGVASHEFFHTLLPIGIHSEEIEHYDFMAPTMSQHLWLYEGMTEYFAMHLPIKQGRRSLEEFLKDVVNKANQMRSYTDTVPLTELSKQALERQDQYYNFYLKGTLFCLMLDIELRKGSKGKYGVQQLVMDLRKEFGPHEPFKDEELFAVIARLTDRPDVEQLLTRYLAQPGPLALGRYFAEVGLAYDAANGTLLPMARPDKQQLQLRRWWLGR